MTRSRLIRTALAALAVAGGALAGAAPKAEAVMCQTEIECAVYKAVCNPKLQQKLGYDCVQ